MSVRIGCFLFIFTLISSLAAGDVYGRSPDESVVIGRLTGTYQELPGYFSHNPEFLSRGKDSVEFRGFRLRNLGTGKNYIIRPFKNGFFRQRLTEGDYVMLRVRKDRPGYREEKTINILHFSVPGASLVNLGTMRIIVQGKPKERLIWDQDWAKGTYTYRYRYQRVTGSEAYGAPYLWYSESKPKDLAYYGRRIVNVENDPTGQIDGSKLVIKDNYMRRFTSPSK